MTYQVTVPSRQATFGEFDPRPTRAGVGARPWIPSSFDVRGEVYRRRVGRARNPIRPLYGPNVAVEAGRSRTSEVAAATVSEVFPERLRHEISRILPRRWRTSRS